jgi:hypothetical protein
LESRFSGTWEPKRLSQEILAEGTYWYSGQVPYSLALVNERYDYTANDLEEIETHAHSIVVMDYIDYVISEEGEVFYWELSGPAGKTTSPTFGSMEAAKEHLKSYGRTEVKWLAKS